MSPINWDDLPFSPSSMAQPLTTRPIGRWYSSRGKRRDDVIRLLGLGAIRPATPVEASLECLNRFDTATSAWLFRRHKTVSLAMRRLVPHCDRSRAIADLVAELEPHAIALEAMHEQLPSILTFVEDIAVAEGLSVTVMKGAAALKLYGDPTQRDFGDLDLFLNSWSDARRLSLALRREGFRFHDYELPWLKRTRDGIHYGQIHLVDGQAQRMSLDIHFGFYSVRHCGRLPLDTSTDPGLHHLNAADNLVATVNNIAGDHFLGLKDANDLTLFLDGHPGDFRNAASKLDGAGLTGFFAQLQHFTAKTNRVPNLPPLSKVHGFGELRPTIDDVSHRRRWMSTALHAFRTTRSNGRRTAFRIALDAARYFKADHSITAAKTAPSQRFTPSETDCLRLLTIPRIQQISSVMRGEVPPATYERQSPGFQVVRLPNGVLFEIDGELFVPTVGDCLSTQFLSEAGALWAAGESRQS